MNKVIIYNQENGVMAICVPALNCGLSIEAIAEKDVPTENYKIIDKQDLDTLDEQFRNAWVCVTDMNPVIDLEKAKEVWKEKIRLKRGPALLDLDVQYMRALESGDDTENIVKAKQELRDLPQNPDIESANSIEDLKNVWHNLLGEQYWHKQL